MSESILNTDCPICLQSFLQPAELPCGHTFCYLCIKGSSFHRRRCPLCRGIIHLNYFDSPKLIKLSTPQPNADSRQPMDLVWYYEGRNGWWQYDCRTSDEIESAFSQSLPSCEVFIAGHVYLVDFLQMRQMRKDRSGRSRHIKRDTVDLAKKGISGIRLSIINNVAMEQSEKPSSSSCSNKIVDNHQTTIETNIPQSSTIQSSEEIQPIVDVSIPKLRIPLKSSRRKSTNRRSLSLDNPTPLCISPCPNVDNSASDAASSVGRCTRSRKSFISLN